MNPILIHKSDSTIFANVNKFLTFNLETDLDLTGWQAKFILGWVEKTIDDISTHSFEIILGAEDTKQLRLGKQYGTIILTDSNGNIKTVTNTIPFEVTTAVVENEYQEIGLTIPESSGVDIKLKVGASTVTSVNGMTGDVVIEIPDVSGLATKEEIPDLTEYVKNTDYSTGDKAGVCKWRSTYGIAVNKDGFIYVVPPSDQQIIDKTNYLLPIIPSNLDLAVKTGVTTNTIELSADEKANAKAWLGYADNTDIMQAIASIPQFNLSIVEALPETGEKMTLYLVPKEGTNNDVYDEYIWIEQTSSFEHLGTTAVDLTDYVKNTDYASATTGGAGIVKCSSTFACGCVNGYIQAANIPTIERYNNLSQYAFIGKATLQTALTEYSKTVLTTEADYEALETKDANTLYLIEE